VYTPYSCFPFRSWWRLLLVSTMFWTIRVRFRLSQADAGVHPTRWAVAMSTPYTHSISVRMLFYVFIFQHQRFDQSF
jgi:hypothetical protein